jgi:hypothetical protein
MNTTNLKGFDFQTNGKVTGCTVDYRQRNPLGKAKLIF